MDEHDLVKEAVDTLYQVNNPFVQSLCRLYRQGYTLTEKQTKALLNAYDRHLRSFERGYTGIDDGETETIPIYPSTNKDTKDTKPPQKIKEGKEGAALELLPLPMVHSQLDDYGLSPYEFRVYAHIVRRCGGKLTGVCFSKQKVMAETLNMSVRSIQYALNILCEVGAITKEDRNGKSDRYSLTPFSTWKDKALLPSIRDNIKPH